MVLIFSVGKLGGGLVRVLGLLTCVLSVGVCSWRVGCGVGRLPMRADQTHGLRAGGARENVDPLAGNKQISIHFS